MSAFGLEYGINSQTHSVPVRAFLKYIGAEQGVQEFAKYALTAVKPIADLQQG